MENKQISRLLQIDSFIQERLEKLGKKSCEISTPEGKLKVFVNPNEKRDIALEDFQIYEGNTNNSFIEKLLQRIKNNCDNVDVI